MGLFSQLYVCQACLPRRQVYLYPPAPGPGSLLTDPGHPRLAAHEECLSGTDLALVRPAVRAANAAPRYRTALLAGLQLGRARGDPACGTRGGLLSAVRAHAAADRPYL